MYCTLYTHNYFIIIEKITQYHSIVTEVFEGKVESKVKCLSCQKVCIYVYCIVGYLRWAKLNYFKYNSVVIQRSMLRK